MHLTPPRGTPSRRARPPRSHAESPASPTASGSLQSSATPSTFTSSLHIPVEGAIPIEPDSPDGSSPSYGDDTSRPPPVVESKRAPRKSKTDALTALHNHASAGDDELMPLDNDASFFLDSDPIPVPPVLDLKEVRTSSPRNSPARKQPRPFGLEDCPVFYPTKEEFQDPMAYIRSISAKAQHYGICKIVPPPEWKMPFVTDTAVRTH
jgi:histone demethylase JARID1